jgi:hypothetical protein
MNDSLSSQVTRYATIFGPVGAFGGFISDVLQPLAPFSWYVFILSLVAILLLTTGVFILREWRRRLTPLLVLCAAFFIFSGGLLLLHTKETEAKGVLAAKIPAIEGLQASLGIIQKDIAEIKETTQRTAEGVARIEMSTQKTADATGNIAKSADRIAGSLDAIQQGFANLSKSGGIIENAAKAEEHYHNARVYEQRGDYINARRSYNAFFAFKLDVLDPHLRYQTFLTVQEGRAGAREIYGAMYEQDRRPLIEFARALLFDAPQRTEMLKAFIAAHADFAPAYYELSREFSAARKGTQSLGDKQAELQALETFKTLHGEGKFLKYFIDKELAAKWLDDAETRAKALAVLKQAGATPVTMTVMRSNTDWMVTLSMAEIPREVFYRLEGEEAFRSLGHMDMPNPATGLKMPNMYFSLRPNTPKTSIHVKYTDVGNEMRGPFTLEFDPEKALVDAQRKILDLTKNGWIAFRDFDGKVLVYFTQLLSSRCALKQVSYGINSSATPSTFELPNAIAKTRTRWATAKYTSRFPAIASS